MKFYRSISSSIIMISVFALLAVSPVLAQQQRDSDGDGVGDSTDSCPNEAGPASNNGCPFIIIIPVVDTDGDGLNDDVDQCPTVPGLVDNNGCPPSSPNPDPNNPPSSNPNPNDPSTGDPDRRDNDGDGIDNDNDDCIDEAGTVANNGCPETARPPFQPPFLPTDACFVTPAGEYNVRVRNIASLDGNHVGNLLPGIIYPALGLVESADGIWVKMEDDFQHLNFEMTIGTNGYIFDDVVNHSNCPTLESDVAVFQVPIDGLACTITTVFSWEFAFNASEGEVIPLGTQAQAILNGDTLNYGDVSQWVAETHILGDETVEYMTYGTLGNPGYQSFPRTGGTCGRIGDSTARHLVFPLPTPEGETEGDIFEDNGELDLFLVNVPGGGFPPPEFPWQVGWVMSGGDDGNGSDTVEICYYAELYEVGVYNEVCVEIEIPEGCVLLQPEAGVYIIECEEDIVRVNPLFGDAPMLDLRANRENTHQIGVQLQYIFNQPAPDDGTETIEYCVYEEVSEAGVFEEVCYEIEIPEGCTLISAEAGVFTLDCDDEPSVFDGVVADDFQSTQRDPLEHPAIDAWDNLLGDLCAGDYIIWWDEDDNGEIVPGSVDGGCMEWL